MRKTSIRGVAAIVIGLGAGALGFEANAAQGSAVIDSKEPGKVVLNGSEFRLSDATAIEDEQGKAIGYAQLPTRAQGASPDAAAVWYEASDDERSPVLYLLKLTGAVPD